MQSPADPNKGIKFQFVRAHPLLADKTSDGFAVKGIRENECRRSIIEIPCHRTAVVSGMYDVFVHQYNIFSFDREFVV